MKWFTIYLLDVQGQVTKMLFRPEMDGLGPALRLVSMSSTRVRGLSPTAYSIPVLNYISAEIEPNTSRTIVSTLTTHHRAQHADTQY